MQPNRWSTAWIDGAAFVAGLALAWFGQWETKDLVWSLWLSSLAVGYAMIVWGIFGPAVFIGTEAWKGRAWMESVPAGKVAAGGVAYLVGGLFLLAFFTVHFGMFHFVHSVFLNAFFPVTAKGSGPSVELYREVFLAYWPFALVAAVAERQAFRLKPRDPGPPDVSVKAADIAARKARNARAGGMDGMMAPYRNVIRLHLLIFFFAFASFAHWDNFAIYAIVYAVYFFPWRLLGK